MNKLYLLVICYIFSHGEALCTLSSHKVTFEHFGLKSVYREAMKQNCPVGKNPSEFWSIIGVNH